MRIGNIIKRGDVLLAVCLLVFGLLAAIIIPRLLPSGERVSVEIDGKAVAVYPLDEDTRVALDPDGDGKDVNILVIKDGAAYVESADCRDGICVAHSPVSKEGETVVCLPHRLIIRIIS